MSASFVATIWPCVPVGMSFPMLELWPSLKDFALLGQLWQWEAPMGLCSTEFKDCWDGVVEYGPSKLVCAVGLLIGMLSLGFFMSNARAQQEPVPFVQAVPPVPPLPPQPPMPALTVLPVASGAHGSPGCPCSTGPSPHLRCPSAQPTVGALQSLKFRSPTADFHRLRRRWLSRSRIPSCMELNLAEGARWVLFKGNDVIVRANSDDEDEARRARRSFSGDLLWFKLDGKAYVSQDRETMNRVEAASSSILALEATIKQLATSRANGE